MITIRKVQTEDRNINQLQSNISQAIETPFSEDVGQFTPTMRGFSNYFINGNVKWQTGTTQNGVLLQFPSVSGTSNTTTMFLDGLPVNLWPKTDQTVFASVFDSSVINVGYVQILTDGTVKFSKDVSFGAFTASGTKGVVSLTISYCRGI